MAPKKALGGEVVQGLVDLMESSASCSFCWARCQRTGCVVCWGGDGRTGGLGDGTCCGCGGAGGGGALRAPAESCLICDRDWRLVNVCGHPLASSLADVHARVSCRPPPMFEPARIFYRLHLV